MTERTARDYAVTLRDRLTTADSDTWVVHLEWVHGIYGTNEHEDLVLWTSIDERRLVVGGRTEEFTPEDNPAHEAIDRAVASAQDVAYNPLVWRSPDYEPEHQHGNAVYRDGMYDGDDPHDGECAVCHAPVVRFAGTWEAWDEGVGSPPALSRHTCEDEVTS